jgi:GntR family transcriptional regulator
MEPSVPPIHHPRVELEKALTGMIERLQPGDRLPPEPELARSLGVSRPMLREVVGALVERGLLVRQHGVGTFVASRAQGPVLDAGFEVLESLDSLAGRMGLETEVRQLTIHERLARPDELAGLLLPKDIDTKILYVSRIIAVAGEPVAYLIDICPQDVLQMSDLGPDFHGSVFDIFLKMDRIRLAYSRTEILAENATGDVAAWLKVARETALIKLTAQLYSQDDQIVDYSLSYFVPGHFKFHVIRRVPNNPFDITKNNHR